MLALWWFSEDSALNYHVIWIAAVALLLGGIVRSAVDSPRLVDGWPNAGFSLSGLQQAALPVRSEPAMRNGDTWQIDRTARLMDL